MLMGRSSGERIRTSVWLRVISPYLVRDHRLFGETDAVESSVRLGEGCLLVRGRELYDDERVWEEFLVDGDGEPVLRGN